jgi:hypothetical protein
MTSLIKSRTSKSLIRCGVIVASLALAGNAFAANIPIPHPAARTAAHVTHSVVARIHRPTAFQPAGVAQLFPGLFGPPTRVRIRAGAADDTGGYDPTFDSPSPAVEVDNSQSQAAIDASDQAIQQMDQDIFQMDENMNNGM